jgi:hypothetical protein
VRHRENLCDRPLFTGFTRGGRYATEDGLIFWALRSR